VKVLVTGGAGFIGSHLVDALLARGDHVTVIDDFNDFYSPASKSANLASARLAFGDRLSVVEADLMDADRIRQVVHSGQVDQIVHLAARAGVRPSIDNPRIYMQVNVEGSVNVLEAARHAGVPKVVLASSSSVYGINSKVPFSEGDPLVSPISPYAASKMAMESLGHTYHHVYGLDVVILRFFTVYGPRQRPDLAIRKFTTLMAQGKPIPVFGDGSTARDYTYVDDIISGVVAAMDTPISFDVFNLGESRPIQLSRLLGTLESALGVRAVIDRRPPQPGDVPRTFADVQKARRDLGYRPTTSIEDGVGRFIDWFRAQQAAG
jgi:UDP-glucuronate 4-epimerase